MRRFALLILVSMVAGEASAQSTPRAVTPPVISNVFPPGATVGTTIEWTLKGRGLTKVRQVLVSGTGVTPVNFTVNNDNQAVATLLVEPGATTGYREVRVEGPDGVSDVVLTRIDSLPQTVEVEPNDTLATAQTVAIESSVAGVLGATDVDHFRVDGPPGRLVTVDFEARRLGTSISPVLTILNLKGGAIAQARESRSADHDARLAVAIPSDGSFVIQVRDNTYGGSDSASYRIRVTTTPFATALFPLGGRRGKPLKVTASGGSLTTPLTKTIILPDRPGESVDPGAFDSPAGKVDSPGMVLVGDDAEIEESTAIGATTPINLGETANGRIGGRNEVDHYRIAVKKGQRFRVAVQAEPLGSWLDSVLTIRNGKGAPIAENDDFVASNPRPNNRRVNQASLGEVATDSAVDLEVVTDDTYTIEVADRYGDGGPEYGYRLAVGVTRPDFTVSLVFANPNANGQSFNGGNNRAAMATEVSGAFNLAPGTNLPINFTVVPVGHPGPVTVRAIGLPEGVTADAVKVDIAGANSSGPANAAPRSATLTLNVPAYAYAGLSEVRIVATAEPTPGTTITRTATADIGLNPIPSNIPSRPITRRVDRFPVRVTGENRPKFVGPPESPRLTNVRIPGVLLAGDRIDLGLDFDTSPLADPGFVFEARAKGVGLATNTVIRSGNSIPDGDEADPGDVIVRVLASPKAQPGVYPVSISYAITGGTPVTRNVSVIVRRPVEVLLAPAPITLKPGGSKSIWVGVRREAGTKAEIELKAEGLPDGVKLKEPVTLNETDTEAELTLVMAKSAKPIDTPLSLRVVAIVRMPRGSVMVESQNRPMILGETVDERGRSRIE
jgi:hypothetical protein